jgi:type VI secretion system protein ImpA
MAVIDVNRLLQPITDVAPCGENLEYDAGFGELERIAKGKEERRSGAEIIPAEEPKWGEVADAANGLLARTRDLRVLTYLTHAALNVDGFAGLAAGLQVVHGWLQTFWDSVYPQLDKEDDNDPTLRINSLAALDSREGIVRTVARVPLVASRAAGRYGLRDIRVAKGEVPPAAGEKKPDAALVDAAFSDCDVAQLSATADGVREAGKVLGAIVAFLSERVGAGRAPTLANLTKDLRALNVLLTQQLEKRGVTTAAVAGGAEPGQAQAPPPPPGGIRNREDAIRILEEVADYFRKHEPSSPLPLLLNRAKRLVSKDFMEILRDLTPGGVSQAEAIGGLEKGKG